MKKRTRIVILAVCALMLYLTAANALAAEPQPAKSRASVEYGSKSKIVGGKQDLHKRAVTGVVVSDYGTGAADKRLLGRMCSQGAIWIHTRDEARVSPNKSAALSWSNTTLTGTFFAEAEVPYGNHTGYCLVQQARD